MSIKTCHICLIENAENSFECVNNHTYCRECFLRWANQTYLQKKEFLCPVCRQEFYVSVHDFFLHEIVKSVSCCVQFVCIFSVIIFLL